MKEIKLSQLKHGTNVFDYDIVGYKKLRGAIAQLVIPAGTKIVKSYGCGGKIRAEKAIVLMVVPFECKYRIGKIFKKYDTLSLDRYNNLKMGRANSMVYRMGETVKADNFDEDMHTTCTRGIHFFVTEAKAKAYE